MPLWCRKRLNGQELIDAPDLPADCVQDTLRDQAWVSRWLGGANAVVAHALPALKACASARVRVLDVACGGADISRRLVDVARRLGKPVEVIALDRSALVVEYARQRCGDYPEISVVQGDALLPPFSGSAFDLVLLTTFLHHLDPSGVVAALGVARDLSRGLVIAVDLVRSPLALTGFGFVARLAGFNAVSRHDGAVSLRRSYTPAELASLARSAGIENPALYRHRFYRMALVY